MAAHDAQAGRGPQELQQRLIILTQVHRKARARSECEAAFGAYEPAYVTQPSPVNGGEGLRLWGAAAIPACGVEATLERAESRNAVGAGSLRPSRDRLGPDVELGGASAVKSAALDQAQQRDAFVLSVDSPVDLRTRRRLFRHSTQPTEAGEGDQPLEEILVVVAYGDADAARVGLAAVLLGDDEARFTFEQAGEEALVELGEAESVGEHGLRLRPDPAENPCKAR
jgi:hypothetical protein